MSLLLSNDPFEVYGPSCILNQHFGSDLEPDDFVTPSLSRELRDLLLPCYIRSWRLWASEKDMGSTVCFDNNQFEANLDVQQFKPDEITVKLTGDRTVTVEGKHEEKQDDKGYISRHFVRRYVLPKGHDCGKIASKLSSDSVLTITAPRIDGDGEIERKIPIIKTGQPCKRIEDENEK